MTLAAAIFLATTLLGGFVLILVGVWRWRAERAAIRESEAEALLGSPDPAVLLAERLEVLLTGHERRIIEAVDGLRDHLGDLKSDVEWLAGERMIEQAIQMARQGSDPEDIGHELGMSRDAAATIALFRKH
ncbi:MAG: hypothetical protein RIR62_2188 [Pseudomonadota bacterium]|jgi:hypothetical protein